MRTRPIAAAIATAILLAAVPATVLGGGPTIERGWNHDTFEDDFLYELCGITAMTTVDEHWTVKTWPDGRATIQVTRHFVTDYPGVPREKGAATRFIAADGTERLAGKPVQLIGPNGVTLLDAGLIVYTDPPIYRGPHPFLDADLADYYCP